MGDFENSVVASARLPPSVLVKNLDLNLKIFIQRLCSCGSGSSAQIQFAPALTQFLLKWRRWRRVLFFSIFPERHNFEEASNINVIKSSPTKCSFVEGEEETVS